MGKEIDNGDRSIRVFGPGVSIDQIVFILDHEAKIKARKAAEDQNIPQTVDDSAKKI